MDVKIKTKINCPLKKCFEIPITHMFMGTQRYIYLPRQTYLNIIIFTMQQLIPFNTFANMRLFCMLDLSEV